MTSRRRIWLWGVIFCIVVAALYLIKEILLPFVVGIAIAYILDPILDLLERMGLSRLTATVLLTATFFVLVIALLTLIFPLLQGQTIEFLKKFPVMIDVFVGWTTSLQQELLHNLPKDHLAELSELYKSFGGHVVKWIMGILKGIFDGGLAIFNILSLIVITPIVSFYLLRDWDRLVDKIDSWLPKDYEKQIKEIMTEIDTTISCFVRGQLTVCLVLATIYSFGLTLVGLDFALLIGITTGLISFVPYFGMLIGLLAASSIAFFQFGDVISIVLVLAVFVVGQIIEAAFLTPKLVGEAVGLHSVWVIFALMVGGAVFGFIGVLLAIPVAAMFGVIMRFCLAQYLDTPLSDGKFEKYSENSDDGS